LDHGRYIRLLGRDKRKRIGFGFKIINGPDEVTISYARIDLTYKVYKAVALLRHDVLIRLIVRSDEFGVLGITGKSFGFRLMPNDEVEWRFPFSVTHYLKDIMAENDGDSIRHEKYPKIELIFSVTASGNVKSSERPISLGGFDGGKTLFGFHEKRTGATLESIILGALAKDALQNPDIINPAVGGGPAIRDELIDLVRRGEGGYIPAELIEWLVDTWEQAGSFSDESTEKVARYLVGLRPPRPNPDRPALIALSEQPSAEQPPPGEPAE
jgi:hypothetical protein